VALKTAIRYKIQLVVWGENAAQEYGGTVSDAKNPYMDRNWCLKYGCLQNREPMSYQCETISERDLIPYDLPSDQELKDSRIAAIFLGHFFPWDPVENYRLAQKMGFSKRSSGSVLGLYDFADLDCHLIPIHHFTKWYKFGIGRTFDNDSVEIRNGRMSREDAINKIRNHRDIAWKENVDALCEFIGWDFSKFQACMRSFANPALWRPTAEGLVMDGFITGEKIVDTSLYE
jgi:hypothetical protein